jgi:hypothetical protein
MANKSPASLKVSLFGVSRNALLLGRACALKDNPILGVYDPDPQRALQAALFLGVSARRTQDALFSDGPNVVLCSQTLSDAPSDVLLIRLGETEEGPMPPNLCWVNAGPSEGDIPEQISNELPVLELSLSGSAGAVAQAKEFLQSLSANITCHG